MLTSSHYLRAILIGTVALVLAIAGSYAAAGEWSTAAGVITGAALVFALVAVAQWRAVRKGPEAATAARVFSGRGDERDSRVYLITLATIGVSAYIISALAPFAVELGIEPATVLSALPWTLLLVGVTTFIITDRKI